MWLSNFTLNYSQDLLKRQFDFERMNGVEKKKKKEKKKQSGMNHEWMAFWYLASYLTFHFTVWEPTSTSKFYVTSHKRVRIYHTQIFQNFLYPFVIFIQLMPCKCLLADCSNSSHWKAMYQLLFNLGKRRYTNTEAIVLRIPLYMWHSRTCNI